MNTDEREERLRGIRETLAKMKSDTRPLPSTQLYIAHVETLLSLHDSQAAEGDLKSRDDVLALFGATLKENGDLSIDMKKYHAAHLCQEHSSQPWRRSEIEEKCVMCLVRDKESAATTMRARCVEELRGRLRDPSLKFSDDGIKAAVIDWTNMLIKRLESLTPERGKESK